MSQDQKEINGIYWINQNLRNGRYSWDFDSFRILWNRGEWVILNKNSNLNVKSLADEDVACPLIICPSAFQAKTIQIFPIDRSRSGTAVSGFSIFSF